MTDVFETAVDATRRDRAGRGAGRVLRPPPRPPGSDRPTVVLLHGWTASSDLQFFTAYEALAERVSFVGIDHRGHGRGLRTPTPFTLEDAADDDAAVARQLGIERVVLVGYSMGGPISLTSPAAIGDSSPASSSRRRRWSGWPPGASGGCGGSCRSSVRGCAPGYPAFLHSGLPSIVDAGSRPRAVRRLARSEMSRNDAFAMVDAGRALSRYDARPWAGRSASRGRLITTRDRLVPPRKQRALAAALGARTRGAGRRPRRPVGAPASVRRAHRRAGRRRDRAVGRRGGRRDVT